MVVYSYGTKLDCGRLGPLAEALVHPLAIRILDGMLLVTLRWGPKTWDHLSAHCGRATFFRLELPDGSSAGITGECASPRLNIPADGEIEITAVFVVAGAIKFLPSGA